VSFADVSLPESQMRTLLCLIQSAPMADLGDQEKIKKIKIKIKFGIGLILLSAANYYC